ncbi:uncharacterized protein [Cherax quadricarinatus]
MALISKEENNGFRIIKALNQSGRRVLHIIFRWGTPNKADHIRLDEYLKNLNKTSSANYLNLKSSQRKFNRTQKKLIENSSDGRGFDVPMLCTSIKLACENVAPLNDPKWNDESTEMEFYITSVKNMRNDALHSKLAVPDDDYFNTVSKLRKLLTECLKTSGVRYGKKKNDVEKEIKQMKDDLDYIMNEILGIEDIIKYCSDDIKQIIIDDCCNKLKDIVPKITYVSPVSFIIENFKFEVDKIFVNIEVKRGKRRGDGEQIHYQDLLILAQTTSVSSSLSSATQQQSPSGRPRILLLEGLAGSGKTTLSTLVIKEWIDGGQGHIRGLDNYELLLWVQCRDTTMISYQDLLDRLLADVSAKFRNFLPTLMKLCKILIVIDGLDEFNDNSRRLVTSLMQEFRNSTYTTFLCTSRPEKVEMFTLTIPEDYEVINAELLGITREHMPEFVRRTHQEITKNKKCHKNVEELINKVMKVRGFQKHLRLPMNLTFFVYIWDQEPDQLDVMTITQTTLYHKIHELCQKKLLKRLENYLQTKTMVKSDLEYRVQDILSLIYVISLESLSCEQMTLENVTVERLISACEKHCLPSDEILSAFFSLKPIWTWNGIEERYSLPHKGIQDYFGALHIVMTLKHQLQSPVQPVSSSKHSTPPASIRGVLKQSIRASWVDMTLYNNVLMHVAGLLYLLLDRVPEVIIQEVVHLLYQSGMKGKLKIDAVQPTTLKKGEDESCMSDVNEDAMSSMANENKDSSSTSDEDESSFSFNDEDDEDEDDEDENESVVKYKWIDLLENTRCNYDVAKAIAPFIHTQDIYINDYRIECYTALLPHIRPSELLISIKGEPTSVPGLQHLLNILARPNHHRCLSLDLHHHYLQDNTTITSDDILQLLKPSSLEGFRGHLSSDVLELLPSTLKSLYLVLVNDDYAQRLLPKLRVFVTSSLPHLEYLGVRVPPGVSPAVLQALPSTSRVQLYLSGVSDPGVNNACDVAMKLQPPGGYDQGFFAEKTS